MRKQHVLFASIPVVVILLLAQSQTIQENFGFLGSAEDNSQRMVEQGRHIFRFDTFGDQTFWGGKLKLHQTINNLTPQQALDLGLKVDSEALPPEVIQSIKNRTINLHDPTVTRLLIKLNAVLGVVEFSIHRVR
jgi:hypothetical protein